MLAQNEQEEARVLFDKVLQAQLRRLGPDHADTRRTLELLDHVQAGRYGVEPGSPSDGGRDDFAPVRELHQDAAMDDYDDALGLAPHPRAPLSVNNQRPRPGDDLLTLDEQLASGRPAPR